MVAMFFAWLKRYVPRGIYGRAALILLVPVLALQVVVSVVFIQRHFEDVTRQLTGAYVLDLAYVLAHLEAGQGGAALRDAGAPFEISVAPMPAGAGADAGDLGDRRPFYDLSGRVVTREIRAAIDGVVAVDLVSDFRQVLVTVDLGGERVRLGASRRRVSASNPHQLLVLMVIVGVLMTLISFIFLRNQLRPIRRLARAADAFGKGRVVPYHIAGADEVRLAGAAFLDMRARIERQIEQRTMMLSGVSHDLRTPLTRLKLGLAMVEGPEAEDLRRDVDDMERLLDEFLAFAKGDALDDPAQVRPIDLARDAVARALRGDDGAAGGSAGDPAVTLGALEGDVERGVMLRPMAMARALDNLLGNALRYGGAARVSVAVGEKSLRLRVEDDGPGIAPQDRDEALKPFTRLDAARNQNRGSGVGLGLAISADIARRHGGVLRLGDSEAMGGLAADIVIPL